MLTIYSGYHLANKKENITLDIRELQPQQKIIEIVTDFVTASEALEDDLLDVGINTTNPLVIATIEAIADCNNYLFSPNGDILAEEIDLEEILKYID